MCFLNKFCCICMNKSDLKHMFEADSDGVSHYNKLTSSIAEMNFKEMNDQRLICGDCCVTLNTVYNFRQMCLRSKKNLINHILQLQTSSHVTATTSTVNEDIKSEVMYVKQEVESDSEHEEIELKSECYEESIQLSASVKEECESEEDSSAHEDATVDHVNEGAPRDVKVKVEHQDEDEQYIEFTKIVSTESLLPEKSKDVYQNEYHKFENWMVHNSVETINETVLLGYFEELSESFSPNSLWTKYSMLKKMISVRKNIDIGKFYMLGDYLKRGSKGYESKKSKVLTREQILKFIHEAPNETYMMVKVALLFCVFGGCRLQELVNMLVDHIEDRGSVLVVNVPGTKTDKKRVFTIIDDKEMTSLELIKEYASLRPQGCSERRFFLNYRGGRCTGQPVGKNTFGKIPSTIATFLNLKDAAKYTGHCLRRTSETLMVGAGASMTTSKRRGRWKNTEVTEGYLEDISSKNKIPKMLPGVPSTSASHIES